jgi:hypothetical protein
MSSEDLSDKSPSQIEAVTDSDKASVYSVSQQIAQEQDHPIRYRSCSWQKVGLFMRAPSFQS